METLCIGLDAASPSGLVDTAVLDFSAGTITQTGGGILNPAATVVRGGDQDTGSTFRIAVRGRWYVCANLIMPGGQIMAAGLSMNAQPAELVGDPVQSLRTPATALVSSGAANFVTQPLATVFDVSQDQASSPTGAIVRVLTSNAAGAPMDPATLLTALTSIFFRRIGDVYT